MKRVICFLMGHIRKVTSEKLTPFAAEYTFLCTRCERDLPGKKYVGKEAEVIWVLAQAHKPSKRSAATGRRP
jgi:hypothetical protein